MARIFLAAAFVAGFPNAAAGQTATLSLTGHDIPASYTELGVGNVGTVEVRLSVAQTTAVPYEICLTSSLGVIVDQLLVGLTTGGGLDETLDSNGCTTGEIAAGETFVTAGNEYSFPDNGTSPLTNQDNPDETITVSIQEDADNPLPASVTISSTDNSYDLLLLDDDPTRVRIRRTGSGALAEGGSDKAEFVLLFDNRANRPLIAGDRVDVPLSITGTGVTASDYALGLKSGTGLNTGVQILNADALTPTVVFSGAGALRATLELTPTDDAVSEGPETLTITLGTDMQLAAQTNTNVRGGAARSSRTVIHHFDVEIGDNDDPSVTIAAGTSPVTEGASATFTVTATPAPAANLPVNLSVADAPHSDFVAAANEGTGKTVTVPTTGSVTYSVATANNSADEPNGPVTVTVETGTGYVAGNPGTASVTVSDNDTTTVTLSGAAGNLIEGDEKNILLTLGRGLRQGETLTAPLTFAGAATRNSDYALACPSPLPAGVTCSNLNSGSASVAFTGPATGTTATSVTIELTATADNAAEATAETVEIGLGALTSTGLGGAAKGVDNLADFTIADPAPPEANFAAASSSAAENAGAINVGVTLSFAPTANLTLNYTVGGTATSASDYAALTGTVAIASGATTVNIPVSITDDEAVEEAETVTLTLATGSGYAVGATNVHTLTIQDNDVAPPEANFAAASSSATEDAGTHNVGVTLSVAPTANVTLNYTVGGTATSATDYAALTGTVAVAANATTVNIPVSITDDEAAEGAETVTLTLAEGSGYAVGSTNVHTLTIQDNDVAGVAVSRLTDSIVLTEGGSAETYTVVLNKAPAANVTVTGTVRDPLVLGVHKDSGAPGSSVTLTFAPTDWNQAQAVTMTPLEDANATNDATVINHAVTGTGEYQNVTADALSVTVNDNDQPPSTPEVTLSASPNPVTEGETITVAATLSEALATDVAIPLALTAGTAEAGDYGPLASIAIAANETSGTGAIATNVDDDADDETFTVALGDLPGGVQPGTPSSVELTIADAQSVTSVEGEEEIPEAFALEQNYPNPFNPSTTIRFALDKAQRVRLAVYDLLGQEVRVLVDGVRPAARYDVAFDAADLASGTYLYVLRAESQVAVKTMSLLK